MRTFLIALALAAGIGHAQPAVVPNLPQEKALIRELYSASRDFTTEFNLLKAAFPVAKPIIDPLFSIPKGVPMPAYYSHLIDLPAKKFGHKNPMDTVMFWMHQLEGRTLSLFQQWALSHFRILPQAQVKLAFELDQVKAALYDLIFILEIYNQAIYGTYIINGCVARCYDQNLLKEQHARIAVAIARIQTLIHIIEHKLVLPCQLPCPKCRHGLYQIQPYNAGQIANGAQVGQLGRYPVYSFDSAKGQFGDDTIWTPGAQPGVGQPGIGQPGPGVGQPGIGQPGLGVGQPGVGQPGIGQPGFPGGVRPGMNNPGPGGLNPRRDPAPPVGRPQGADFNFEREWDDYNRLNRSYENPGNRPGQGNNPYTPYVQPPFGQGQGPGSGDPQPQPLPKGPQQPVPADQFYR